MTLLSALRTDSAKPIRTVQCQSRISKADTSI